jgi:molybdopterin-biosynthesis enzyme MoeA-like protein
MAEKVTRLPVAEAVSDALDDMTRPAPNVEIKVITPEPAYSRDRLESGIKECDRHIELLEESIDEANQRKKELKRLLRELED